MRRRRVIHRSDLTQKPIVKALRSVGAEVEIIGDPVDLLVAFHGRLYLGDCKTRTGRGDPAKTAQQLEFVGKMARHRIEVHFWETPEAALKTIGCGV